ncbi:hypothetical protein [Streptomyces sp. CAI-85]|uniref:hypothetical protein n=1 Tax=Streptomyces sp. CAI-85 TaxID=1472662 RepID=UPI001587524B|nr:hypothetical protein [Streptomyces sp. CAI-85]NUV65001.1 hypothetical protein [Streptomyces sp. CAI-85]
MTSTDRHDVTTATTGLPWHGDATTEDLAAALERAAQLGAQLRAVSHSRAAREAEYREVIALSRWLVAAGQAMVEDITDPARMDRFPLETPAG